MAAAGGDAPVRNPETAAAADRILLNSVLKAVDDYKYSLDERRSAAPSTKAEVAPVGSWPADVYKNCKLVTAPCMELLPDDLLQLGEGPLGAGYDILYMTEIHSINNKLSDLGFKDFCASKNGVTSRRPSPKSFASKKGRWYTSGAVEQILRLKSVHHQQNGENSSKAHAFLFPRDGTLPPNSKKRYVYALEQWMANLLEQYDGCSVNFRYAYLLTTMEPPGERADGYNETFVCWKPVYDCKVQCLKKAVEYYQKEGKPMHPSQVFAELEQLLKDEQKRRLKDSNIWPGFHTFLCVLHDVLDTVNFHPDSVLSPKMQALLAELYEWLKPVLGDWKREPEYLVFRFMRKVAAAMSAQALDEVATQLSITPQGAFAEGISATRQEFFDIVAGKVLLYLPQNLAATTFNRLISPQEFMAAAMKAFPPNPKATYVAVQLLPSSAAPSLNASAGAKIVPAGRPDAKALPGGGNRGARSAPGSGGRKMHTCAGVSQADEEEEEDDEDDEDEDNDARWTDLLNSTADLFGAVWMFGGGTPRGSSSGAPTPRGSDDAPRASDNIAVVECGVGSPTAPPVLQASCAPPDGGSTLSGSCGAAMQCSSVDVQTAGVIYFDRVPSLPSNDNDDKDDSGSAGLLKMIADKLNAWRNGGGTPRGSSSGDSSHDAPTSRSCRSSVSERLPRATAPPRLQASCAPPYVGRMPRSSCGALALRSSHLNTASRGAPAPTRFFESPALGSRAVAAARTFGGGAPAQRAAVAAVSVAAVAVAASTAAAAASCAAAAASCAADGLRARASAPRGARDDAAALSEAKCWHAEL